MIKKYFHIAFENKAKEVSDNIAIEKGGETITYGGLNEESNKLSHLLLDLGVKVGDAVGVLCPSGIRLVSGLISTFKCGAIYVPLDISFPFNRFEQIVLETKLEVLIIGKEYKSEIEDLILKNDLPIQHLIVLPEPNATILEDLGLANQELIGINQGQVNVLKREGLLFESLQQDYSSYSDKNPEVAYSSEARSYIFYTSGSTGRAKGIVGSHEGISHYVQWHAKEWSVDSDFRISQLAPVTFDASLKDILVALISGARLCIPTTQIRENMLLLGQWLSDSQITLLQTVPSVFRMLTKSLGEQSINLPSLKYVVLAGEKLYGRDIQQWESMQGRDTRISNLYGLTETTVLKSCYHLNGWDWEAGAVIPVGKAISNSLLAVINETGLCSRGEIGEIYIKSPYVSKGYVDESLNEGLFVQNPLVIDREDYVCRTGDMGRYNSEGLLEVLGRIDDQIKLHGVRVELEEVRGAMLSLSGIEQVELVLHQTEEYQQELICYYTGSERSGEELRRGLSSQIPQYSLPGYYVWLEEFPLNLNGKVDKKALPRPESLLQGSAYEAPQDELERSVSVIWQEVLGLRHPVGRQDSFFNLGGSSLKAIQLISRLYKQHEVQLSIGEIFSNPELNSQAELIRATKRSAYRSISRVAEQEHYALSHAQRRLWVLEQRTEEALPFNGLYQYRLYGKLDRQALARAFDTLLDRHESLRTVFELINGEVRQRVLEREAIGFAVDYEDLSESTDPQGRLEEHLEQLATTAFDLSKGPLLRVKLLRLGREEHAFLFSDHHIISDEWSMQVLFKEVLELYNAYYHGQSNPLTPLAIQYKDYVGWQLEELSGEKLEEHRRYWLDQFSGELPVLELPSDRPRPPVQSHRGDQLYFKLPEELSGSFQAMLSDQGSTLFMGLVALVKTLLYRYTGQSDLIIGTPVAGRDHPDLEDQIGYYLNTLGLRTRFSGSEDYLSLLSQVKQVSLDGFAHQVYPFDYLIEELGLGGDPSRAPLSDVVVILQNIDLSHGEVQELADIRVESVEEKLAISKGDLRFQFSDRGTYLDGSIEYNTDLYDRERMERMVAHLENLLSAILSDPTKSLLSLEYLSKDEKALSTWFSKTLPKHKQTLVHELIEAQVLNGGDRIAVEQGSEQLSYQELNGQSNQLSALLLDQGVELGNSVGVLLPAGLSQVSSLLGIFKIGAVYVPLSTSFPADRLALQLEDAQISHVLTNEEGYQLLSQQGWSGQVLVLPESGRTILGGSLDLADEGLIGLNQDQGYVVDLGSENTSRQSFSLSAYSDKNPEITYSPDAKSYIFYTSGSTGKPKGIVGSHEGISHYVQWHAKEWSVDSDFRISQLAPVTFDASLKDILVALISGARLCVPTTQIRENMLLLGQWLRDSQITLLQTVPSVFRMLTKSLGEQSINLPSLKYVVLAGEKLYGRDIQQWESVQGRDTRISNLYGLTETTVLKSCYHLNSWDWEASTVIPVGTAIQESMIGVMHEGGLCMWGEIGEIYIKSPYVSKGYVDASLNEGLFVQNPLVTDREDYVCRTGDMGRYNSEGLLEVLGRIDDQIKLHGVRVKLEEVRGAMLSLSGIEQVELVLHQTEEYQQELICYYTGSERSGEELRRGLSSQIPQYSLPGYYVWLEEFPLNLNGKVDKKALPRPESLLQGSAYEAPQDELERSVSVIWQEVLGLRQPVGRQDSFFNLGGSSLKAIQLISRLYKQHEVQLSIGEIFSNPELSSQAELIRATKRSAYRSISRVVEQEHYALSHAQRRLWVLDQLQENLVAYSRPIAFRLHGQLNRSALEAAFATLIDRHESLRTVFEMHDNQPVQRIVLAENLGFELMYQDLRGEEDVSQSSAAILEALSQQPFDLSEGPLLRARLLRQSNEEYLLLFAIHHIISDEWSMQVLIQEIVTLYNAYNRGAANPLKALPIQYKDYAAWQLSELSGDNLIKHRSYWQEKLGGNLPILNLAGDYARPSVQSYRGRQLSIEFKEDLSDLFESQLNQRGITLFMGLVGLVKVLLYRYTGQSDLIIGTPVAGRDHVDLDGQIGFYINNLALRTSFNGSDSFEQLLSKVKQTALDAYSHQVYPFDLLVDELDLPRDLSRFPLFDVVVVLQNDQAIAVESMEMDDLEVIPEKVETQTSLYDLTFWFRQTPEGLKLSLEYNTDIYAEDRMERMGAHLQELMSALSSQPQRSISEAGLLTQPERQCLLEDFNATHQPYANDQTLVDLFEAQVRENGDSLALQSGATRLSYAELNARSNQLAHYLKEKYEIGPDTVIGVMMQRSEWLLIGILGVLKSGGAYLPIDRSYPQDRVSYMLSDAQVSVLLTDGKMEDGPEVSCVSLTEEWPQISKKGEDNPPRQTGSEDLAYVIYTSGSTGKPKGVMIQHSSLLNYLNWANDYYFNNEKGREFAVLTSISFDLTITSLFSGLLRGDAVYLFPEEDILQNLHHAFTNTEVKSIKLTPSHVQVLGALDISSTAISTVILGGERVGKNHVESLKRLNPEMKIFNEYGPTEATVGCSVQALEPGSEITIGYPISNTHIYILDSALKLQPIGIPGEIFVSGTGLARGYLGKNELTSERFPDNPFGTGKLYKTGDLGRWTSEGNIEYLGRTDEQVKIRGNRVEPGEIAAVLNDLDIINEAFVTVFEDEEDTYLVAYYTAGEPLIASQIRLYLKEHLPNYMMPSSFIYLDQFPLTTNGKIDKGSLPDPNSVDFSSATEYVAPRNEIEEGLVTIWEELLDKDQIGIYDNFFDLGGHSLKAVRLLSEINKEYQIKLELKDIFENPVIEEIAVKVEFYLGSRAMDSSKIKQTIEV